MGLPFVAEAVEELEEAADWYDNERPGLGEQFATEVARIVERAAELPHSGSSVAGTDPSRDVRRFVVRRFPYLVVTAIIARQRAVVAVAHHSRRPGYWRDRLQR